VRAENGRTRRTGRKSLAVAASGAMILAATVVGAGATAGAAPVTGACVAAAGAACAASLDPTVAPGGNFDLSVWELQLPIGSPGSPTTIPSSQLKGADGYTNPAYFWTDKNDGSMTFWDPEAGVTTPNSNYARSELREMNTNGSAADWSLSGTHKLSATLRIPSVTSSVCVGQIHLGSGGSSTKPLLELYYHSNGDIVLGLENSPDGGQTSHTLTNVSIGTQWSYVIAIVDDEIQITVNGAEHSYPIASGFKAYHQYFKAGDYNQSSSDSTSKGAKVKFYALNVQHG
jgi:Alginate lyase